MRLPLQVGLAIAVLAGTSSAQAQMRFPGLDQNNDGVITRGEWRGSDQSFRSQDWNGDGILSGDEVRVGARRRTDWNQDWNRDGRIDNYDIEIVRRFRGYDTNNDNRVARSEWPGGGRLFLQLDTNRDGYVSMLEYAEGSGYNLDALGGPSFRFSSVDVNNDGWITRNEWNMSYTDFNRLDVNRDNRISRFEFENAAIGSPSNFDRFDRVDLNNDGWLVRSEWRGSEVGFTQLDTNRDNRLSRSEFNAQTTDSTTRSAAWRTGWDHGIQEGKAAGREDYVRGQGWDLEGQRELERADSGFTPQIGALSDFQAGYREGFRTAYRAGFIEAGGRAPQ